MKQAITFKIIQQLAGTMARAGVITTAHGTIKTPAFIVGGTQATVKALTPDQVANLGGQSILVNSYHLMLRPGADLIDEAGGLAKFMSWDRPTFSDSGGFQVFSLGVAYKKGIDKVAHSIRGDASAARGSTNQLAKVTEEGVYFKSHIDGRSLFMSPELSMELQHKIGADIHFAFDELPAPLAPRAYIENSLKLTNRWASRGLHKHQQLNASHQLLDEPQQALFGIVQGARFEDLRRFSAQFINQQAFDGFGIGGVFEPEEIPSTVRWATEELAIDKPRHLLGMGSQPADLFLGVEFGVDTFDCVAPTRQARNGAVYTSYGRINIKNAKYYHDFSSIDAGCNCYTCQHFSRAYLNHLFKADEILAATLASIHNEYFIVHMVDHIRDSIIDGSFLNFKAKFLTDYYGDRAERYINLN